MKRAIVALVVLPFTALAHGEAEWIQTNPEYVDKSGIHCCGHVDCGRISEADVDEVEPGVWRYIPTDQRFRQGERGTYASIDVTYWACKYQNSDRVRCLFSPQGMF